MVVIATAALLLTTTGCGAIITASGEIETATRELEDFDKVALTVTQFRLMQGTNRPWRDVFRAALDGGGREGHPHKGGQKYPKRGGQRARMPAQLISHKRGSGKHRPRRHAFSFGKCRGVAILPSRGIMGRHGMNWNSVKSGFPRGIAIVMMAVLFLNINI